MLKQIIIERFKKVSEIVLNLDRVNILVGANNSGKTSILQAIQFAIGAAQTANKNNGIWKSDTISYSGPANSFLYLPILELDALIYNRQLTQSSGCTITFVEDQTGLNMVATIKRGKNRNISIRMQGEELFSKLASLDQQYCVFTPGLSGITLYEEFRTKAIVNKSATRGDSNLFLR